MELKTRSTCKNVGVNCRMRLSVKCCISRMSIHSVSEISDGLGCSGPLKVVVYSEMNFVALPSHKLVLRAKYNGGVTPNSSVNRLLAAVSFVSPGYTYPAIEEPHCP